MSSTVGGNSKLASDCRVLGAARQDGSCNEIIALCPPQENLVKTTCMVAGNGYSACLSLSCHIVPDFRLYPIKMCVVCTCAEEII